MTRTGHDGRVRARTVRTAQERRPTRPGSRTCRTRGSDGYAPRTHLARRPCLCPRRRRPGVRVSCCAGLADRSIVGHSAGTDPGRRAWYWARSPRSTSRRRTSRCSTRTGRRVRQYEDSTSRSTCSASKDRCRARATPTTTPWSNPTNRLFKKELVYRNHYTTIEQLRHDLNDYVWWSDNQRLHSTLGYRSPKEFTEQGLVL